MMVFWQVWIVLMVMVLRGGEAADGLQGDESMTVIDVLSEHAEFSMFLRVIQKSGIIPYLNGLTNITLVAPVNSAFAYEGEELATADLKQYIIGDSIVSSDVEGVEIVESLEGSGEGVFAPVLVEKLHYGPGQAAVFTVDGVEVVESDMIAYSQDGVVQGVNRVLPRKTGLCDFIGHRTSNYSGQFDVFSRLVSVDYCPGRLSGVTVLLVADEHIGLNGIELRYLESVHGTADRRQLVNASLFEGYIGGRLAGADIVHLQDFNGKTVQFQTLGGGTEVVVDGQKAVHSNLVTRNGIVHIMSALDTSAICFSARKYLYGLGCDDFVQQIEFRDLEYLIDDPNVAQTLFLYNEDDDDDSDDSDDSDEDSTANSQLMAVASSAHKNTLLYHFVDGHVDVSQSGLYDSKFCSNKKIGHTCQKIKLNINNQAMVVINDDSSFDPKSKISIGATDIYFLNKEYSLPLTLKKSVNRCTKSIKYLEKFGLLDLKNNRKGYTVLLPCFDSWARLDLTLDYLEHNKTALQTVLKNSILHGLFYSNMNKSTTATTLNGDTVQIKPENNSLAFNGKPLDLDLYSDILFDQGVVLPINNVLMPSSVDITMLDLVITAKAQSFIQLLAFTNLSHVLSDPNYSILVPTSESLLKENFTVHTPLSVLTSFLKLHILPNNYSDSHDSLFNCGARIPTLLESVHLSCRAFGKTSQLLQIVEGFDNEVRVLKSGCSTLGDKACVFVIDRAILPLWLNTGKKIKFHLPFAALGIGFISGIIFIFVFVPCCLLFIVGSREKPVQVADEETPQDQQTLLPNDNTAQNSYNSISDGNISHTATKPQNITHSR